MDRHHSLTLLLVAGLAGACAAPAATGRSAPSPSSSTATPTRLHTSRPGTSGLTGDWITRLELGPKEPSGGRVEIERPCYAALGVLHLVQNGTAVRGTYHRGAQMRGAVPQYSTLAGESFTGTLEGTHLRLRGAYTVRYRPNTNVRPPAPPPPRPVTYDLTWNRRTGHLVGTKNGKPFWAAPRVLRSHRGPCGSPPP